ncbi:PIN domain-containing protein [Dyadobacter arcticus]|uniref:Nucleic acid-binding protein n=1 Tax=Dyadobacter arcticus TaxID=1078754 RepID=A0ABX0US46_9BACT|nr:PIN domain-containing protein [Dyadobacter arcticus]NIJ54460.1 putative nucleic acid-binding protein [Dyadobacter arcticus]
MIHSARFVAILDACILYPAPVRDLLMHLADVGLYTPKWTDKIHEEWTRNLLQNRPDIASKQLQRTIAAMQNTFPDANVSNYESLIESFKLPDPNDAHVLAAAIRCKADVIVTANMKDFPNKYLQQFDIEAQHPDFFISNLIELNPECALTAFNNQIGNLRNPPMTAHTVLDKLRKAGLQNTSESLDQLWYCE